MSIPFFFFSWAVTSNLIYLQGCPEQLLSQARTLIDEQRLDDVLVKHYPGTYDYATDKTLWQYTQDLKNQFPCNAPPINKVMHDNETHVLENTLGSHTAVSRMQSGKLKAKAGIRAATVSRNVLEPFLRMIVVYRLAYLKEKEHNKTFYQLCCRMRSQYHQPEFDTRLWLMQLPLGQDKI